MGDLVQVVEVVRDLAGREARYGLSAGERRLLAKTRIILIQEGLCPRCFQLLIL
jgi:RNA polymerase-interacting CarD/CdnL/TRCF family regulator